MSCWEILEIEPTEDIRTIKQAYAKKLKSIDIKNDVAKFQELKEAFDLAKKIAQLRRDEEELIDEDIYTSEFSDFRKPMETKQADDEPLSSEKVSFEIEKFENSLENFLEEEDFYDEVGNWQRFLQPYLFVDLESFSKIQNYLRRFLIDYYQIISKKVRTYIFELSQMDDAYGEYDYILDYAEFDFSFYREIALSKRRDYFQTRNQLFLLLFHPDSEDKLLGLLQYCKDIYQQDNDLALLEVYLILWQDFRLENSTNISYIKSLAYNQRKDDIPWDFIITYSEFVLAHKKGLDKAINPERIFRIKNSKIPDAIYELLAGNCAYLINQRQAMYYYWHELQKTYPDKFNERESVIEEKTKKHGFFYNWRFVIVGILIIRFLFKLGQLTEHSASVTDIDTDPTSYSELLSELAESESDTLWETAESTTATADSIATFEKDLKVFSSNPNDEPVSYESYGQGSFVANVPDFEHYNQSDAEIILGSPSQIIEKPEKISQLLEEQEQETITAEVNKGNLTTEQAKAFMMQAFDSKAVVNRVLVYGDGKPNIYLSGDKVIYITPITKYVNFNGKIK
jgi:hypothetical protein